MSMAQPFLAVRPTLRLVSQQKSVIPTGVARLILSRGFRATGHAAEGPWLHRALLDSLDSLHTIRQRYLALLASSARNESRHRAVLLSLVA